ncbi:MAG TPA: sensor histidine kinase [Hyphomicrobiaceae bacterium]|nr:sensor histidine kinase [Hyphomicrobiaceae bacterium]
MWSLRRSLVLLFVAIVAMPLSLFWAWPHSASVKSELDEVRERHLLLARNLGVTLSAYHRDVLASFNFLSETLLEGGGLPEPRTMLAGLRIRHICLVDPTDGRVIVGYLGADRCPKELSKSDLARAIDLAKLGGTQFAPVHQGSDGSPTVSVVRLGSRGLVIAELDARYFAELGKRISFGENGHAVIVDQTGTVLAHPMQSWEKAMRNIAAVPVVQKMIMGKTGVDTFFSPAYKDTMVAGYTSVPGPGWGIMVPQPMRELKAAAARSRSSAVSVFAFGLLAAALIACRAAILLIDPVRRVIVAAERMSNGDANVRIDVSGRFIPREMNALVQGFNAMAERVSASRLAEAEARRTAERASQSKSEFLNTVTHELRSPLNAIIGFADIMASGRHGPIGDERYRTAAEDVRSASRHLLALTNDLLDLARIEAGQFTLADDVFDLDEVTSRAARFVEVEAQRRGTRIEVSHPDGQLTVAADERIMFQSTLNLVVNAVRYGGDNGHVRISAERTADGGVAISVADDGPGIGPEDLERVLRPFARTKSSERLTSPGSGLGLPIVAKLAELHGGRLELASAVGVGTTATVYLPAKRLVASNPGLIKSAA